MKCSHLLVCAGSICALSSARGGHQRRKTARPLQRKKKKVHALVLHYCYTACFYTRSGIWARANCLVGPLVPSDKTLVCKGTSSQPGNWANAAMFDFTSQCYLLLNLSKSFSSFNINKNWVEITKMRNYKWNSHVLFHTVHTYSEFQEENVSNRTLWVVHLTKRMFTASYDYHASYCICEHLELATILWPHILLNSSTVEMRSCHAWTLNTQENVGF